MKLYLWYDNRYYQAQDIYKIKQMGSSQISVIYCFTQEQYLLLFFSFSS